MCDRLGTARGYNTLMTDSIKIALPKFLQLLNLPIPKAVVVAGKMCVASKLLTQYPSLTPVQLQAMQHQSPTQRTHRLQAQGARRR